MDIDSLKSTYQDWVLHRYVDSARLEALMSGSLPQVYAERMYSFARYFSRGHILVNAWYNPGADPYGEYPYEIQFFFATSDGEILKEVSIFDSDMDTQYLTITEAMDDIDNFFWKRLSMKLSEVVPLLGEAPAAPPEPAAADANGSQPQPVAANDDAAGEGISNEEPASGSREAAGKAPQKPGRIRKTLRSSVRRNDG